eukprot:scaffold368_cov258-Pinguiococcus_pyrenoidosus.AAC.46
MLLSCSASRRLCRSSWGDKRRGFFWPLLGKENKSNADRSKTRMGKKNEGGFRGRAASSDDRS